MVFLEFLDLRSHVWGIRTLSVILPASAPLTSLWTEQDIHKLAKKESTSVRIWCPSWSRFIKGPPTLDCSCVETTSQSTILTRSLRSGGETWKGPNYVLLMKHLRMFISVTVMGFLGFLERGVKPLSQFKISPHAFHNSGTSWYQSTLTGLVNPTVPNSSSICWFMFGELMNQRDSSQRV